MTPRHLHVADATADPTSVDLVDISDDHARLSVERLPRAATRLGCRVCGATQHEHGVSTLHRFVRPDLPAGYRYLDSVRVGDALALRRDAAPRTTVRVAQLERALVPNEHGLLWLRTAEQDAFLLHPATIVAEADTGIETGPLAETGLPELAEAA